MRIAISSSAGIGNLIEATPAISAMRVAYPNAEIILYVDYRYSGDITRHFFSDQFVDGIRDSTVEGFPDDFDLILVLDSGGPFEGLLKSYNIGSHKIIRAPYFLWNNPKCDKSETELNHLACKVAGYKGPILPYFLADKYKDNKPEHDFVAIGIGYQKSKVFCDWSLKHWGNQNYADLIHELLFFGKRVVLLGSKEDWETDGKDIVNKLPREYRVTENFINLCGFYSDIWDTIDYMATMCDTYIGNDSGLGFVAAALDMKTIIVAPDTIPHPTWKITIGTPHCEEYHLLTNPTPQEVINYV